MALLFLTALFALLTAAPPVQADASVSTTPGIERQGSVYEVLRDVPKDPEHCRAACDSNEKCVAYTYYKPWEKDPAAHCWLMDKTAPAWTNECCVSGTKTGRLDTGVRVFTDLALRHDGAEAPGMAQGQDLGLDLCLDEGFECGWPAAHAYCAAKGAGKALDYQVKRAAPPTRALAGGPICTGQFCHRITKITCDAEPGPAE